MPTIHSLLKVAYDRAQARFELLLLLAGLAGIATSFLYRPTARIIENALLQLETATAEQGGFQQFSTLLADQIGVLLLGYIGLLAATAFFLPYWARAAAPADLTPNDGGMAAFIQRGAKTLLVTLVATAATALLATFVITLALMLSSVLGGIGSLAMLAAALAALWFSLVFAAIGHAAICFVSTDTPIPLRHIINGIGNFLRPAVGSLAVIWLGTSILNLLLSNLAMTMLPDGFGFSVSLVINGMTTFLTAALHISLLYSVPGITERP